MKKRTKQFLLMTLRYLFNETIAYVCITANLLKTEFKFKNYSKTEEHKRKSTIRSSSSFHHLYCIKYLLKSEYLAKVVILYVWWKTEASSTQTSSVLDFRFEQIKQILPILCGIVPYGPLEIPQGHTFTPNGPDEESA